MFSNFRSGGSASPVAPDEGSKNTMSPSTSRRRRPLGSSPPDAEYDRYHKGYWRKLMRLPSTMGHQCYLEDVEERCKDATFCSTGMIGPNERLVRILVQDEETLKTLLITRHQIADVLQTIDHLATEEYVRTSGNNGKPVTILDGRYQVQFAFHNGSQRSPFQHPSDKRDLGCEFGDRNLLVTRLSDGEDATIRSDEEEKKEPSIQERQVTPRQPQTFAFSSLLIPMIRYNGFFEGKEIGSGSYGSDGITSFRIDPLEVVTFFKIQAHVDYAILYEPAHRWESTRTNLTFSKSSISDSYFELSKALAIDIMNIPNTNYVALLTWVPSLLGGLSNHGKIYTKSSKKDAGATMKMTTVSERIDYILAKYGKSGKGGWFGGLKNGSGGGGGGPATDQAKKQGALNAIIQYHGQRDLDPQCICLELFESTTIEKNDEGDHEAKDTAKTPQSPTGEGDSSSISVFGAELDLDSDVFSSSAQKFSYICFQRTTHQTIVGWNHNLGVFVPPPLRLTDSASVTSTSQGSLPSHTSSFERQFLNNNQ